MKPIDALTRALPLLVFVAASFGADSSGTTQNAGLAGTFRCARCHTVVYEQWRNRPEQASCESCHGPGRAHVLAPTPRNIVRVHQPGFRHGPDKPEKAAARDTLRAELFVMSRCPYGTAALRVLLPLLTEWKQEIDFHLYFIAHRRSDSLRAAPETGATLDGAPEKCESSGDMTDGTDRYVSLHGLTEVLEDIRQCLIQERIPGKFYAYLSERVRDMNGDWKTCAKKAGLTEKETTDINARMDTPYADSLFDANIAVADKRRVTGSPTLFINGSEFAEAVTPYPVERHFCQDAPRKGPCKNFPACGFDTDCRKPGMEATCISPMTPVAKCRFTPAAHFTYTVLNDEACPTCHTGNLVAEIKTRFPGARPDFVTLGSDSGKALIVRYGLKTYPAFLFDTLALKSDKFQAIAHTFTRVKDRFVLQERVVKTYHRMDRKPVPGRLAIFGSFENPPFIEMLRDLSPVLSDSARHIVYDVHPYAVPVDTNGSGLKTGFDSPYGAPEVREGMRSCCVQAFYPGRRALGYMLCRGQNVQARFETHAPEPDGEWQACADSFALDKKRIRDCADGAEGESLFRSSLTLSDSVGTWDPAPSFLVNNYFKVTGYNPAVKKILKEELKP